MNVLIQDFGAKAFSRNAGKVFIVAAAPAATCAFHSSAVFGITFHVGLSGAAINFRICGLTLSGTGIVRAGILRGASAGLCAINVVTRIRIDKRACIRLMLIALKPLGLPHRIRFRRQQIF